MAVTANMTIGILDGSSAGAADRRAVAEMIIASLPDFYRLLAEHEADVAGMVAARLIDGGGEMENCHILQAPGGVPAGVFCAYPSDALARAQMVEVRALLRGWDRERKGQVQAALAAEAGAAAPVPDGGCYLSRFAIADGQRGTGLADRLMAGFLEFAAGRGTPYLHVDRNNGRAIAFYQRHGYRFIEDGNRYRFQTMERPAVT